jgi:tetratricopeptide (TPR) repeat protein
MSLMLGNRYFLDRDYARAVPLLEAALAETPDAPRVLKRLVISYVQLEDFELALERLERVLTTSPRTVIDTDPDEEDCPCPALCAALERRLSPGPASYPILLGLGILELYCDLQRARRHLLQAYDLRPVETRLGRVLALAERENPSCRTP